MRAILAVLVAMIAFDAVFFVAFPRTFKRWIEALSPGELRIIGAIELLIAGTVVYYLISGV